MVDVVCFHTDFRGLAITDPRKCFVTALQSQHVLHRCNNVGVLKRANVQRRIKAELLVDLVATNLRQVVATRRKVKVVQQRLAGINRGLLARTHLLVDGLESLFLRVNAILIQGLQQKRVVLKLQANLFTGQANGLEQQSDRQLTLAVDAHHDGVAAVDFEFKPGTARRDNACGEDVAVRGLVCGAVKVHARRTNQLRDNDAFGAVDDEGALVRHKREVAHENGLRLDFARLLVREVDLHIHLRGVGQVPLAALCRRVNGIFKCRFAELKQHGVAQVSDWG